jgi:DNA polymerase III subunit gamma/tau
VLVRIAHAADLPTPDEVIRALDENGSGSRTRAPAASPAATAAAAPRLEAPRVETSRGAPRAALAPSNDPVARAPETQPSPPALAIARFEDLIALAAEKRDLAVKLALERDVRLVRCEDGRLEIALERTAAKTLVNDLARKFSQWTNRRWMVVVSAEEGQPTVRSQSDARQAALKTGVRGDPLVQAVLARFPGAEIVDVREGAAALPQELPSGEPEDTELAPEDNDSGFSGQFPHNSSPNQATDDP